MKSTIKFLSMLSMLFGVLSMTSCGGDKTETDTNTPSNLRVSAITSTGATLAWTSTAKSFQVDLSGDIHEVNASKYTATGLEPETNYTWKVRPVVGSTYGDWVSGESFTTKDKELPVDPTNARATAVKATRATLAWDLTGGSTNDSYKVNINGKTLTSATTTLEVTGLSPETTYSDWTVTAIKGGTEGTPVAGASFTTTALQAPTNAKLDQGYYFAIMTWDGDADNYEVELDGEVYSENGAPISAWSGFVLEFNLENAGDGLTAFRVRAAQDGNYSAWVDGEIIPRRFPPTEYTDEAYAQIVFNGDAWSAESAYGVEGEINGEQQIQYQIYSITPQGDTPTQGEYPYVVFFTPTETNTLEENVANNGYNLYYYETKTVDNGQGIMLPDWLGMGAGVNILNKYDREQGVTTDGDEFGYSSGYVETLVGFSEEGLIDGNTRVPYALVAITWNNIPVYQLSDLQRTSAYRFDQYKPQYQPKMERVPINEKYSRVKMTY